MKAECKKRSEEDMTGRAMQKTSVDERKLKRRDGGAEVKVAGG